MRKLKLNVVVAGNPHPMELADDAPVEHLVHRALHETGHFAPALGTEWELRNIEGVILTALLQVADGATLFLSPKAGMGGNT